MPSFSVSIISLYPNSSPVLELIQSIARQGIQAFVFKAVDGRNSYPDLLKGERLDQAWSLKNRFIELTKTEVACYLSHLRVIRQAYEEGIEKLCVLEDDISIEDNFGIVLNELASLPDEFEFVRLMGLKRHPYKIISTLIDGTSLTCPVKGLCGAQGYLVNRSGMKKIIDKGSTIYEPIDKFYDHFWDIDLHCFAVVPHIIWERPTTSTIAKKSRRKATRKLKLRLLNKYYRWLRSYRRKLYINKNKHYFKPAQRPAEYLGRTARIH